MHSACSELSAAVAQRSSDLARLSDLLEQGNVFALTGAGVSTDSGIPGYRDELGAWKAKPPVQYRDFVGSEAVRKRYWARSMLGYPLLQSALPNAAHHALRELEARGRLSLLVTQNVDGLHRRAGHEEFVELHGRLDQVRCLGCGALTARAALQTELAARNPQFARARASVKPDGDAELHEVDYERFEIVPCADCGGMLKPHVVFFGENVPALRVTSAMSALERSTALLVIGSSLQVFSGFRFARAAVRLGLPIAILNRGLCRADEFATLKIDDNAGETLGALAGLR